jgi:hypothetical protein
MFTIVGYSGIFYLLYRESVVKTLEFIRKAKLVQDNSNTFEKTVYISAKKKVIVTCLSHGDFEITPNNYLSGKGCRACGIAKRAEGKRITTSDFIRNAIAVHGTKYSYVKTKYVSAKEKVTIVCYIHGDFEQIPGDHTSGCGCPMCGLLVSKPSLRFSDLTFVEEALRVHGSLYSYAKSTYAGMFVPITISCFLHGDFDQIPVNHLKGHGCPCCGGSKRLSSLEFSVRASVIHNGKYGYQNVKYVNSETPVEITCYAHGPFLQRPDNHLCEKGCGACSGNAVLNTTEFIRRAVLVHGDTYIYSESEYKNTTSKVAIMCRQHGRFMQTPGSHFCGRGCPACVTKSLTLAEFLARAREIHGDYYDYSLVTYVDSKTKIKIICPKHGVFTQVPNGHLNGAGCSLCSGYGPSKPELEVSAFITSLVNTKLSDRTVIKPQEIDCFIPSKNLGVEFCGLYYHSEKFKFKNYHLDKLNSANTAGVDLIHVFEDEWAFNPHIVKSIISNRLGLTSDIRYARKTEVREVSSKDSRAFLEANHLQGSVDVGIRLGLYQYGELLMVATFSENRKIIEALPFGWYELVRLCTKVNTSVVGGFSKLLKHFKSVYSPKGLKTYCDRRYFTGGGYEEVGFTKERVTEVGVYWVKRNRRYSRYVLQKHKLEKKLKRFDLNTSGPTNLLNHGYYRIYDCGNIVFTMEF